MRTYKHDFTTNKMLIKTSGKADWQSLSAEDQATIKRNCLWSSSRNCWISRGHYQRALMFLGTLLERLGFTFAGTVGEKLSFSEQVEQKMERAEVRLERMEDRTDKAKEEWAARHRAADQIADCIPMGQPILVGHHSEKRHRRDLAKIHAHMDKAAEAAEKREHYARRAEAAQRTAEGKQYESPAFLGRRIREQEAEERRLQKRLQEAREKNNSEWIARLETFLEEVEDKLGFYRHCLEACKKAGAVVFDKESLKGKTHVLIRGEWHEIVKLNPTTVAVPNIGFPTVESQRKWALKYPYSAVRDAR